MEEIYELTCGMCDHTECAWCQRNKEAVNYELYHGKVEADGCKEYME